MREKSMRMSNYSFSRSLALLLILVSGKLVAQTGPGGVGNGTGASGQPKNIIWLSAGVGVTQSGTVDSWADQSGNSFIATGSGATRPSFVASDANFNGMPVINFAATGTNKHLVVGDDDILDNTTGFSLFVVFRTNLTASNYALLSKRTTVGADQSYMTWVNAGQLSSRASASTITGGTINNTTTYVGSTIYSGSSSTISNFINGSSASSGAAPASVPNNPSNLYIGAFDVSGGETRNLDGRIAEAVIYTSTLNVAQRQLVENYLAAKYNLTLSSGDVYAGDGSGFDFEVIGIGRASGATHTEASSSGFEFSTYNGTLDADGEFLLAGHNSTTNSVVVCAPCAGYPGSIEERWARTWFVDKTTASTLDAAISFDFGDGIAGQFPQNKDDYELLYSSDGGLNFSVVTIASGDKSIVGDKMTFRVANASLLDGIYTIGTTDAAASPIDGAGNRTWYSYQTGNWENPTSWTLDGGVIPLYVNPGSETPGASDNVVITSGRTISFTTNSISGNNLEVDGILNVASTSGHSFANLSGTGRIRISGSGGADNFPTGNTDAFANATTGGSVEVYGTGMLLSQNHLFNDLIVNLTSGTLSLTATTITLNGDLEVDQGTMRFNDGVAAVSTTLTVNGNVTVSSLGSITVSTSNLRHEFNFFGDLTNDGGTVQFTNRASAVYTSEATNGIVDANFLSGSKNQNIVCDGVTRFYRIEIDKGTDDTYLASFSANVAGNFLLFGYSNENHADVAQLTTTANSFALLRGTAQIRSNISIPVLSNNGNYNISAGATLWVNGGTVLKNNGNSLVPYGKLRVTAGTVEARVNAGITTRDNGSIIIDGSSAIINTNQIRTSVLGASNVGGYVQTAGSVTVDGGGPGGSGLDYYVFSLTYTGNVFQMSGGTLTVKGARSGTSATRGAIFINSDPANVSVTGGTIVAEISNGNPYVMTSRAPFWNLIVRNTFNTTLSDVDILGGTSGPAGGGASEITLAAQDLVVLGGLTIEDYVNLDHNGKNVNIQGNLTIHTNGDLEYDASKQNTTTFDGEDNSLLTFYNHFTAAAGDEQFFWNFVVDKPSDKTVTFESAKVDRTGNNNNLLRINGSYFKLLSGIVDQGSHSVRMYCDVVENYGTLGVFLSNATNDNTPNDRNDLIKFRDDNNPTTLLTIDSSVFGAVRLNSGDEAIDLVSDVYIQFLQFNYGRMNLGSHNLKLDELRVSLSNTEADSLGLVATGEFSVEDMFIMDGNHSDGGLSIYVPALTTDNTKYTFPIGIGFAIDATNDPNGAVYTQARVNVKNVDDDGYITINPVQQVLQTTNLSGGSDILSYYWRVRHEGFSTLPTVSYEFIYDQSDVGGTETNYRPGKVLDSNPFTRSTDGNTNDVDETWNILTFNGTSGNGNFPGVGFALEEANYTAGGNNRFTGTVRVLYTRQLGDSYAVDWTNTAYWTEGTNASFGVHDSRQTSAGVYPQAGDIAVIGWVPFGDPAGNNGYPHGIAMNATQAVAEVRFTQMLDASNDPTERVFYRNFQFRPTLVLNNTGTQGQIASGAAVSGEGLFWIRSTGGNLSDPAFTGVDLGEFNSQDSAYFIYENTLSTGTYTNLPDEFPNLMMATDGWGNQDKVSTITKDIEVNGDLELLGNINLVLSTGASGNITVDRNLRFFRSNANGNDSGGGGELRFGNSGTARAIVVKGDLLLGNGYAAIIQVLTPGATPLTHRFDLHGDFTQNTTGGNGFKAGMSSAQDRIHMNLLGDNSMTLSITAGDAPQFYSLTVNKGTSTATEAVFNSNVTINGPTNTGTKPLTLTKGLLKFNHASIAVVLSTGGGNFSIPSGAGLEVANGMVYMTGSDTGLLLDGLLRVSGGTVNLDDAVGNGNNYIEYSASGSAILEVTAGTLTVGSQIRRNLTSTAGILKYRQSGGAVVVGRRAAPTTSRGVFEVINNGSEFTHTAGTLTLVRGINSTTVPSLLLEPQTPTIFSNSTIIIGSVNTPSGVNGQNIGIRATGRRLGVLTINNASGNSPRALIYSSILSIDDTFTIDNGASFDAQGFNLLLRGNMVVNGEFIPSGNTVVLAPTGPRTINGLGTVTFYDLTKSTATSSPISLLTSIEILNDFRLQRGDFNDNGNTVTIYGNAYFGFAPSVHGTHTSTSGGQGIIFAGSTQQQLFALRTDGAASLGTITISNPSGVVIPDQADKFTINTELRLENGVLDIGGSLLTLAATAEIEEVNLFSVNNMIQTNSSFTDNGVTKNFAVGRTADFTFPIGQLLYTPVSFDFADLGAGSGSGTTPPSITVRPANERQPIIQEDVEDGDPFSCPDQIDDLNNVLQYHWIITASNANNLESSVTLEYDPTLVALANGKAESDYIATRVRTSDNTVFKFPDAASVDEISNIIHFEFNDVSTSEISGEYLAGVDCAIPNNIVVYTTKGGGAGTGSIADLNIYDGSVTSIPAGAVLIVSAGDVVDLDIDNVNLYRTEIEGTLRVESGTLGNRLGTVVGTGNLRLEVNAPDLSVVLPAGFYNEFFSCSGGGLELGGNTSYEVLGGINSLRRLTLDGTGSRLMANNDLSICEDLTLNGSDFLNPNNRSIVVDRDVILNGGSFSSGINNAIEVNRDFIVAGGSFNGQTSGDKIVHGDISVTSGTFTSGSGGTLTLLGDLTFSAGTFSGGSGTHRTVFQGTATQATSGAITINRLEIDNSFGLTLGGATNVNTELLLTNGNITPGSNAFVLGSTAIVTPDGGQESSFVNGRLRKTMTAGSSFLFPIGRNGLWRYASIANPQPSTATWEFEYINQIATTDALVDNMTPSSASIKTISGSEHWKVSDGTGGSSGRSATIGLSWGIESDVSASSVERQDLVIMLWNDATSLWDSRGGTNFSSGNTQSRGSFNASSTISFSEQIVTLGSTDEANPLPITLVSFVGELEETTIQLRWETSAELNNDYFEVQRSSDGYEFVSIGSVKGSGTTQETHSYHLVDEQPLSGKNYYRLKQVDFDGKSSFSDVILVNLDGQRAVNLIIHPNPTQSGNINLKLIGHTSGHTQVRVFDLTGRVVWQELVNHEEVREGDLRINTDNLKEGIYVVEVLHGYQRITKRLLIVE